MDTIMPDMLLGPTNTCFKCGGMYIGDRSCPHCEEADKDQTIAALRAELADLRQWKSDVEAAHRQVMDEKCPSDEQHCTCVPVLRREIASLTLTAEGISEQCKILNGALARYREALNIAEMLIDFIPEGWGMPFGYGVVVTQFKEAVRLLEGEDDNIRADKEA